MTIPGHETVVAYAALFVALGGTSYAVSTGSIDSREIRNETVRSKDIRNSQVRSVDIRNDDVRSRDVRDGSLLADDFGPGQLPAGLQGQTGARGPAGAQGPVGPQGVPGVSGLERISAASANDSESPKTVLATCPAGKRTISGGAEINFGTTGTPPDQLTDVVVTNTAPSDGTVVPGNFFSRAHEEEAHAGNWNLEVRVLCANVN
jgi:hypothetical protein